ncbi:hypothetical protein LMG6871_03132 [Ralstonia edaphis]|uniref:DUF305 domain-containing protein n=1 Tax=Ralstonia edaphi TaxID=3058599 RepID=UPI0028F65B02|nr:DUF305 domain-containing protein [Ralstonia sp. LMG 6871]CAJ0719723.1 hypothetical protein LMG6871_03132 [Ralstonia sp. LMG 6871]
MSSRLKPRPRALLFAVLTLISSIGAHAAFAQQPPPQADVEQAFLAENDVAMTRMMDGMASKPSGNIDQDFVAMMAPHHQGAIDMAVAYLRYGQNEQLRRIAQEIIVAQQQEIAAMRLALGQPLPPSAPAPTTTAPSLHAAHHGHTTHPQED